MKRVKGRLRQTNITTYSLTYLDQIGLKWNGSYFDLYVPIVGSIISGLFVIIHGSLFRITCRTIYFLLSFEGGLVIIIIIIIIIKFIQISDSLFRITCRTIYFLLSFEGGLVVISLA